MTAVPTLTINDGNQIPQLGFGVFQIDLGPDPRTLNAR
jgi:diketogulonate reductase-like aldo/keto reductase